MTEAIAETPPQSAIPPPLPEQGQLVEVRARQWVVAEVDSGSLEAPSLDPLKPRQHLVTLRCVDDDAAPDESLQVIWEIEPGARIVERGGFPIPDRLDDPAEFAAFLDAVRWGSLSASNPRQLLAPFQSGVDIESYQLDPLARAIEMARVSLLIADDVGLGKTIEAGLIVKELLLRYRARRVLVVAPADLTLQWRDEMRDKFGLEFRIIDSALIKSLRREQGLHANPWSHFPRLITSIDFLKQERVMRRFRETLPGPGDPRFPRPWDLLIVDEAHNVAPAGRGKYVTESQRTRAIREITEHCEHRIFLTATPHNGYDESFTALLELLDSQRFARGVAPTEEQKRRVMVRRLKSELPAEFDERPRFPKRELQEIDVDYPEPEREAHRLLRRYGELRTERVGGEAGTLAIDFVLQLLKKRLLSSPQAFANTLAVHRETITQPAAKTERRRAPLDVLRAYMDRAGDAFEDDEEYRESEERAHRTAVELLPTSSPDELEVLDQLIGWAEEAARRADAKANALIDLIEQTCRTKGRWNGERIIVFTEYRDTQKWLFDLLDARGLTKGDRVELIWGGMDDDERAKKKAAFQADPADAPVRVLIGTDAASEGINLQRHCHRVVHYEIPWNPVRLEQRNGRVDRHGQTHPVQVFHFVPAGWREMCDLADLPVGELDGDLEFLRRVVQKVEAIREMLGSVGPVIARQVSEAMLGRITQLDTATAEVAGQRVRSQLDFERKLDDRIRELVQAYDETRAELHLTPSHVQHVVEVALSLARQQPLTPATEPGAFRMPQLTGGWSRCTDGLAHPFTQAARPITFDPLVARGRDDVVLCHVGHRLVQMALRLLRAEVFQTGGSAKLGRVSAVASSDPRLREPLAVAFARLVIIGAEGHRLHEEIIQAGGYITEGRIQRERVRPLAEALEYPVDGPVDDHMAARIVAQHAKLIDDLDGALRERAGERERSLRETVETRLREEHERSRSVLEELRSHIEQELTREKQLSFFDDDAQRGQYTLDREFLRQRLDQIPRQIEEEAAHLARRFRDPQARIFPIAVEYRIPQRLVIR